MRVAVHKRDFSVEVIEDVNEVRVSEAYRIPVYVLSKDGDAEYGDLEVTFPINQVTRLEVIAD
jgi:hypothetical protein